MEKAEGPLVLTTKIRPKILVVDDQSINIRLVGDIFKSECDVYMAMEGEQAIAQCLATLPDLVLLDLVMPGIDGYEVCRRLKAQASTKHIPIIFITSQRDEADEALGFELGAVDYVTKPFNQTVLRARVNTHLLLKLQSDRLRSNERFMQTITDNIPGLIGYWSPELRCMFANAAFESYFGKTPAQVVGMAMHELVSEALYAHNKPRMEAALRGEPQRFERTFHKADGTLVHMLTQYMPDIHEGQVNGVFVLSSDVSDLKHAQLALSESEQFVRATIDTVPDTICVLDRTGVIIAVNQAWREFYDANRDVSQQGDYALGTNYLQVCELAVGANAGEAPMMAKGLAAVLAGERDVFSMEYPCHSDNEKRFFYARVRRFPGNSGHVLVAHGNVTERKMIELELARMAHTDALTGLHNRRQFTKLSEIELSRAIRHGSTLSVLMLDIDHFKRINDTYGHQVGDRVIQMLAMVCREQLRDLDVIGRLGGEEFAIAMPAADHAQALRVAERLRLAIEAASVQLPQGDPVRLTVSIGVTTLPTAAPHWKSKWEALLDRADQALYKAKNQGRNQVCGLVEAD